MYLQYVQYRPVQMATDTETGRDPKWESQLKPITLWVAEQLSPRQNFLPSRLFSANLISENEEQRLIKSNKTETELALDILTLLRRQCSGSFDKFCQVLLETKDHTLRGVEQRLRPGRPYGKDSVDGQHLAEPDRSVVAACQQSRQESRLRGNVYV